MRNYIYLLGLLTVLLCLGEVQAHCYSSQLTPSKARPGETIKLGVKIYKGGLCLCPKSMVFMTVNISVPTGLECLTPLSQRGTEESFTLNYTLKVRDDAQPSQYVIDIHGEGEETWLLSTYKTSFNDEVTMDVLPVVEASTSTQPEPIYENDPADSLTLSISLVNKGIYDATGGRIKLSDFGGLNFPFDSFNVGDMMTGVVKEVEIPFSLPAVTSEGEHTVKFEVDYIYGAVQRREEMEVKVNILSGKIVKKARDALTNAEGQLADALQAGLKGVDARSYLAEAQRQLEKAVSLFSDRKFNEVEAECNQIIQWIGKALKAPPRIGNLTYEVGWSSALIRWNTDEFTDGKILYGPGLDQYDATWYEANLTCNHEANLTGLSPSSLYYYVVKCTDKRGNVAETYPRTFFTQYKPVPETGLILIILALWLGPKCGRGFRVRGKSGGWISCLSWCFSCLDKLGKRWL